MLIGAHAAGLIPGGRSAHHSGNSGAAGYDRSVQPELERFVAKRMGARTYDVDSSHVPMLSQPGFVLDVIRTAANSI